MKTTMRLLPGNIFTAAVTLMLLLTFSCGGEKKKTVKHADQKVDTASYAYKENQLNNLISKDANNAELYNQRAKLHLRFGDFQKAMNDVSRAITIDTNSVEYIYTKGDIYFNALRLDKAMTEFEKVLSKD